MWYASCTKLGAVALGLPCVGKRDAFVFSSYKQKFCQENCKKLLHNYPDYTTDNFRRLLPEFQTLKYTKIARMHLDDRPHWKFLEFRWLRKWRTKLAMSCGWLRFFNRNPFVGQLLERTKIIWTGAIAFKIYCIEKIDT